MSANKEYLKLAGLCVFNAALITGLEYLHKKKSKNVSYKTFKVEEDKEWTPV